MPTLKSHPVFLLIIATQVSLGLCAQTFGSNCGGSSSERDRCTTGLICLDQKCACRFPNHQVYDSTVRKCRSLVRGPCDTLANNIYTESEGDRCVQNAQCLERNDGYKECQCEKGFVDNAEGTCDLDFGSDCYTQKSARCDQVAPLFCREGTCNCKDELEVYDQNSRKCKGGRGAFCETDTDCYRGESGIMECKKARNSPGKGQCNCKYGSSCSPPKVERTTPGYYNLHRNSTSRNPWSYTTTVPSWRSYETTTRYRDWRHFNTTTSTPNWRTYDTTKPYYGDYNYDDWTSTKTPNYYEDYSTTRRPSYKWSTTTIPSYNSWARTSTNRPYYYSRTTTATPRSTQTGNNNNFSPSSSEEEAEWINPKH